MQRKADSLVADGDRGIEAWSFVPHPEVISQLAKRGAKRFIVAIDTLRSGVYFPVLDFLKSRTVNVSSYYSGGWADFLCDLTLREEQLQEFLDETRSVLVKAGIRQVLENEQEAISVFEVVKPFVVCGRVLSDIGAPQKDALQDVIADRVRFERCYRNYRAQDVLDDYGPDDIKRYLRKLKEAKIILCYKIVTDFVSYTNRDYVPMLLGKRPAALGNLLKKVSDNPTLLKPVRECLEVARRLPASPEEGKVDPEEVEVTHLFINEYAYAGEKRAWKLAVYEATGKDTNVYNYPLEGIINESPIHFSDLPEALAAAKRYTANRSISIGTLAHEGLAHDVNISLPVDGLRRHGITLGQPGTGKTNADVILVSEAARWIENVLVIDATGGISSKIDPLIDSSQLQMSKRHVESQRLENSVDELLLGKTPTLVTCTQENAARLVRTFFERIQAQKDLTTGNEARRLRGLLLVEEVADVFVGDTGMTDLLVRLLQKAARKGWAIWLSLQNASALGSGSVQASDVLALMANRILFRQDDRLQLDLLTETFRREEAPDPESLVAKLPELQTGCALCRGVDAEGVFLPPVFSRIRLIAPTAPSAAI